MLGRPNQLTFFSTLPSRWDQIDPPVVLGKAADTNNYTEQWAAIVKAAQSIGWQPADVRQKGTTALAAALASEGTRNWSQSTITRYAKLLRFAGVDNRPHPSPNYTETLLNDPASLWKLSLSPTTQRNSLAALITWQWPAELPTLLNLKSKTLHSTGVGFSINYQNQKISISDPNGIWQRWRQTQASLSSNWLFCTVKTSSSGSPPGTNLSIRGFQAAFAKHVTAAGVDLNWKQYRAIALRQPHANLSCISYGVTTALRERRSQSRKSGFSEN